MPPRLLALMLCCLGLAAAVPARAQSVVPPGGQPAATAAGGTEGRAGRRNVRRAIRSGKAVRLPGRGLPRVRTR